MSAPGLLIVAHGTRDPAGVQEAMAMLHQVRASAPDVAVECGFLELASPGIGAALDALVASGARDVVVFPCMLFAAGHTKCDIPAEIGRLQLRHRDVALRYARHFGIDADLLALLEQRLDDAVPEAERERTAVLLVGRGSSDPDANSDLCKIARLLYEGRPYPFVEVSFSGISPPLVPEGLERCRRLGAQRLVVVPYFLFTGILPQRIREQSASFASGHPGIPVRVARHLWPDDRLPALVLARYREGRTAAPIEAFLPGAGPFEDHQHHPGHHRHRGNQVHAGAQGGLILGA